MSDDQLALALETILAPLVEADEGQLFVVEASPTRVRLHLAGRFSGCPGNALVTHRVIEPLVRKAAPDAAVEVTSGALVPEGSRRVDPRPRVEPPA